jgi:arylsulfatase A
MDEIVGRVVDAVDQLGLRENTLILYYSDNGTDRRVVSQTSFGAIAGGKGKTTDAGTHVPLIARWPGRIKPGINDDLVDSTDFLPIILEAAGRPLSKSLRIDGHSFFPQLLGQPGNPRKWIFSHYDPRPGWDKDKYTLVRFVRNKRFKLYGDGRLFDVPDDRLEQHAIPSRDDTAKTDRIRAQLARVLESMNTMSRNPK